MMTSALPTLLISMLASQVTECYSFVAFQSVSRSRRPNHHHHHHHHHHHLATSRCNNKLMSLKAVSQLASAGDSSKGNLDDEIYVMVNGMPGPMATAAAEACLRKGLKLSPVAMTGPDVESCTIVVHDAVTKASCNVRLIPSTNQVELESALEGLRAACGSGAPHNLLAIDFTHPSAVNANARFYIASQLSFVMGTTGGDRQQLLQDVQFGVADCNANNQLFSAVIAPNMGKQIVAMQAALEDLAAKYPASFDGYKLQVTESHQKTKADTSGTAKAVVASLKQLSRDDDFSVERDIDMIRDEQGAIEFGVPEHAMRGHAFHTYTLTSPDGSVQFQLQHNVAGRTVYAEGTADAVKFLARKLQTQRQGRIYNMIDVLEEGALE